MCDQLWLIWVLVLVTAGNAFHSWWNPRPDPHPEKGASFIAIWNAFDEDKWGADGVRYHKRTLFVFTPVAAAIFLLGWRFLGAVLCSPS